MRMPKNPKPFDELVSSYEPNDLVRLLGSDIGSLPKDRYLHWDQLRHLPPPEGFTSLDWWTAVKFKRMVSRHELPFKDTRGRPFSFSDTGNLYRQLHQVDRDASGRIEVPHGDVVNSGSRERYLTNSLIEEAITSSQLEGAVTTRRVAKELLRSGRPPRDNSERMIVNNYSGMEFLRENIDEDLTVPMLMDLQGTLTEGTLDRDAVGRLRRPTDVVAVVDQRDGEVVHTPPDASQFSDRVELLLDFANGRTEADPFLHPVAKAILLHFMGGYAHPSVDG
ncbi:MAG: Fic family protein, partial [Gemmatimonadetes bacterium]|nr:Fic family protein [Gemmatimonadota bacterium]